MAYFDATETLCESTDECAKLLSLANTSYDLAIKTALSKASILLFSAKFEAFLENILDEFCHEVAQAETYKDTLPQPIYAACLEKLLDEQTIKKITDTTSGPDSNAIAILHELLCPHTKINKIDIITQFNYGKHGEAEVKKLFKRIGFPDIFTECTYESIDVTTGATSRETASAPFNSLNAIRNNILHSDANPALTTGDIYQKIDALLGFALELDAKLEQYKITIHAKCGAPRPPCSLSPLALTVE